MVSITARKVSKKIIFNGVNDAVLYKERKTNAKWCISKVHSNNNY